MSFEKMLVCLTVAICTTIALCTISSDLREVGVAKAGMCTTRVVTPIGNSWTSDMVLRPCTKEDVK
ncbi:hypothetical protein [Methylobacter sp.]|uniref:hypothetical protein n=1 Tax=Methylobacter sp. TaxID=2051955 RepID=UPI0011FE7F2C|nr:hypothetical protein [Methylobacter sp.]TAK59542.1 MAG: hypothetical protein EPO18_20485 [Methylobacter sp.]